MIRKGLVDPSALAKNFRSGQRIALSRALSLAEREDPAFPELFDELCAEPCTTASSKRIGFTGPPGAGKSTLVSAFAKLLRERDEELAILAVDPTSPFTGGALLGDRVRMNEHTLDPGVFIRSMATRGSLGGLARGSVAACDLLAAFGFPSVLVETVGVGQSEYDVMTASDLVLVVLHPGAGDGVQAMKAGLLELADVFVLNKMDLPGIDRLERELEEMLQMRLDERQQDVPICRISANTGEAVPELLEVVEARFVRLEDSGEIEERRRRRRNEQLRGILEARLRERLSRGAASDERLQELYASGHGLYRVADRLLSELLGSEEEG